MSLFLAPKRAGYSSIGICDRCHMKFYLSELKSDSESPGLKVCRKCCDGKDPYELPPRKTEDISLNFVRPDERLE